MPDHTYQNGKKNEKDGVFTATFWVATAFP